MALIKCEPKEVDLLQLEQELGCQGINTFIYNGEMYVEADCPKKKLENTLSDHTPDPAIAAQREAAQEVQAQQAEAERQTKCEAIKAKLKLTDEDLDCLREALR